MNTAVEAQQYTRRSFVRALGAVAVVGAGGDYVIASHAIRQSAEKRFSSPTEEDYKGAEKVLFDSTGRILDKVAQKRHHEIPSIQQAPEYQRALQITEAYDENQKQLHAVTKKGHDEQFGILTPRLNRGKIEAAIAFLGASIAGATLIFRHRDATPATQKPATH